MLHHLYDGFVLYINNMLPTDFHIELFFVGILQQAYLISLDGPIKNGCAQIVVGAYVYNGCGTPTIAAGAAVDYLTKRAQAGSNEFWPGKPLYH